VIKEHCLLDTGAKINVISLNIIEKLKMSDRIGKCDIQVTCANDSRLVILGVIFLKITINKIEQIIRFYVAAHIEPSIIAGIEMMTMFNINLTIDSEKNKEKVLSFEDKYKTHNNLQLEKIMREFSSIFMKEK